MTINLLTKTPLLYELFGCSSNNSFKIIIKIGHAVECTQGGGVEGPGTCVTMWSFNPISNREDVTLRYCQQGELIKPESNIHSECTLRSLLNEQAALSEQGGMFLKNS